MVICECKVDLAHVIKKTFTVVHEDIPKCMPKKSCHEHELLDNRGFESRRASDDVSPVAWISPSGLKKTVHNMCARTFNLFQFYFRKALSFGKKKCLNDNFLKALQKCALSENGYRIFQICAKRILSAPCRGC